MLGSVLSSDSDMGVSQLELWDLLHCSPQHEYLLPSSDRDVRSDDGVYSWSDDSTKLRVLHAQESNHETFLFWQFDHILALKDKEQDTDNWWEIKEDCFAENGDEESKKLDGNGHNVVDNRPIDLLPVRWEPFQRQHRVQELAVMYH